ncbi:MAG TPA: ABC transporter substrate binding protein [Desulfobacteraceae bacterium]|nr:ABC transporter substrate binding protein [Desulfobacteraceae bacterium]
MKNSRIYSTCSLVLVFLFALGVPCSGTTAETSSPKKVLVVHSYHETQKEHVVEMTMGIRKALEKSNTLIEFFHMDTKRKNSVQWKREAGRMAERLMNSFQPDIVITMDDNAQDYFARKHAGKKGAPVFVFGGVNAKPEKYGFPAENVTGVIERPNILESITFLQKIVPGVEKMVMIADKSPTTDQFCQYAKGLDLPVEVIAYEQPRTFAQWKAVITRYQTRADAFGIYVIRTIERGNGDKTHVPEKELMDFMLEHSTLPMTGFFDTAAKAGILCGVAVSMREQGFAAGKIANQILNGASVSDFTVQPTTRGRIMLNLKTAEKLGIKDIPWRIISRAGEVVK